ncbi:MAG: hypothetical protein PVF43_03515 [Candidatus Eiseniibacteriota bacterium]
MLSRAAAPVDHAIGATRPTWQGALEAGISVALLVGGLLLTPDRFLVLSFAVAGGAATLIARRPLAVWVIAVPLAALANLQPWRAAGSGALYPAEAFLLAASAGIALRGGRGAGETGPANAASPVGPSTAPAGAPARVARWALWGMVGWMALAAVAGLSRVGTPGALRALRLAWMAGVACTCGARAGWRGVGGLSAAAAASALLLALAAAVEVAVGASVRGVPRIGQLVGGSELLAIHLTLVAPLALGLALARPGRDPRAWLGWAGALGGLAALGVSFSRSGWVGGWLALLVVAGLAWWWGRRRAALVAAALLLLVGGVAGLLLVGGIELPGVPAVYAERLGSLGGGGALLGDRTREWQRGIDTIAAAPLVGHADAPNCYNLVLGIAARSGLPAAACFLVLVVVSALRMMAAGRAWRPAAVADSALIAGCLGGLVGLLTTGIGESSLGLRVVPLALTLIGLGAGLTALRRGEAEPP